MPGSMPPRRRARTTAPTAATSSRKEAISNGARNFVSSRLPIAAGVPNPGAYGAPFYSTALHPVPRTAMKSSTAMAPPQAKAAKVAPRLGFWPSGWASSPTYWTTKM
jgi:hypothetical protein